MYRTTLDSYQQDAARTAKMSDQIGWNLNHAAIGMLTEAGEFGTCAKRVMIYNKPLTEEMRVNAREELGDLLWYVALAATALDISLGDVADENIAKLRERFPDKYSDAAAEARADKGGRDALNS